MIVASRNELRSLLKYALQGLQLHSADYEGSTELILWCAVHGSLDWSKFSNTLERIKATRHVLGQYTDIHEIDLQGQSLALYGTQIGDLAIAHALKDGHFSCQVNNCYDAEFLGAKLSEASQYGLSCAVLWQGDDSTKCLVIEALSICPELNTSNLLEDLLPKSAEIFVSQNSQHVEQFLEQKWSGSSKAKRLARSAEDLQAFERKSIEHGINIPHEIWTELTKMASGILVPNSEQSRKGAGA